MIQSSMGQSIVLITDPRVIAIPIVDNKEPLVDLNGQDMIAYGPSPEVPNNTDYTKMRKTVYEKLVQAQLLLPTGLKLCLYEGYRSLSLQEKLFNDRYHKVQSLYPQWAQEEIFNETTRLVSPVTNQDGSRNIPPHSTGAAVDVYLINEGGQPIEMGLQVKDWMEDKDGSLSQTDSRVISSEAQENRKIMARALESVGFANYPTEFWHWSYGDRYWAYQSNQLHAIYGSVV